MISFNDLARRHAPLRAELDAAIARVLGRGWYILGPEVEAFEREFAAYCGADECIAVANGTDALEIALRGLSIGPGDEVITVANAGMYATTAIRATGAAPVYVDVDPATLLLDAAALASCPTSRTRAVIVTHLYGRLADVDRIAVIARERGIALIEDCAQAHGACRDSRRAGTFGTFGCFSFYPTKNLGALGDAGAIVTGDAGLAAKVRALRTYGWGAKYHCEVEGGKNSRLDELQAAVLRVQLPHLDAWNRRRREIAARYARTIAHPAIMLPPQGATEADVAHLYVVRTPYRTSLREHLAASGVATDAQHPPRAFPVPSRHVPKS
jgi:dTDP-4-amino-4,6-dideoxygalactose transaminase